MRVSSCDLIFFLNLMVLLSDDDFFCFFIAFTAVSIRNSHLKSRKREKGMNDHEHTLPLE